MKKIGMHYPALVAAITIAACSQGPSSPTKVTSRSEKIPEVAAIGGTVRSSAAGDVKNGPIEMDLVRVGQTDGVPAFYAFAGGTYTVKPNREVEIYVQIWTSNPAVTTVPRLIVDWGVGEPDNIHCGPCRLSRTYQTEGRYTVTVTMDDRVGGVTRRTFTLNVSAGAPQAEGFGTFSGSLDPTDPTFSRAIALFVYPTAGACGISGLGPQKFDTYKIVHLGGPLRIETTLGTLVDSYLHLYAGSFNPGNACQNIISGDDDGGVGFASLIDITDPSFPAGTYIVVVAGFDSTDAGSYTVTIQ